MGAREPRAVLELLLVRSGWRLLQLALHQLCSLQRLLLLLQ